MGTAAVGLLAGCGGTDDQDSGSTATSGGTTTEPGPTDTGDTPTASPTTSESGVAVTTTSAVAELSVAVTDCDCSGDTANAVVTATVENGGGETTDVANYHYQLTCYDGTGRNITDGDTRASGTAGGDTEIAPGETAEVLASTSVEGSNTDIARGELALDCDGTYASGVYCDS